MDEVELTYDDILKEASSKTVLIQSYLVANLQSEYPTSNNSNATIDLLDLCHNNYYSKLYSVETSGFLAKVQNFLQGTGWMEFTYVFIGSYAFEEVLFFGRAYSMSLAFIWVFIMSFVISLLMMIDYSSFGIKEAFLTRKKPHSFANQLFCGWDFCITNAKAAKLHQERFCVEVKSNLAEVRRKKEVSERSTATWVKLYFTRTLVNVFVVIFVIGCYVIIYQVVVFQLKELKDRQLEEAGFRTLLIQFLPSLTVMLIECFSPAIFTFLVSFEDYDGETTVNISILRNVFTSLSSIIVLVSTIHRHITCSPRDICGAGKSDECRTPNCWETFVGQQLYKLKVFEVVIVVVSFLFFEMPRDYLVRNYPNRITRLLGRSIFFLPTEVLMPIYSQTVLWLGILYCPLLPAITVIQFICLFYTRKEKVLNYSEPSKVLYKASRFNSVFINTLLIAFIAVFISCSYTLVR